MNQQKHKAWVENYHDLPTLMVDGVPMPPMSFQWGMGEKSEHQLRKMYESGVRVFFVRYSLFNPEPIQPYLDTLHRINDLFHRVAPEAYLIPWIEIHPYEEFGEEYPDEILRFDDGGVSGWNEWQIQRLKDGEAPRFTYASEVWKEMIGKALRAIVREVNATELSETIIGYFLFSHSYEWSYFKDFDRYHRALDFSPAMYRRFRSWLRVKYRTEEALRAAWKNPEVTFDTAEIPTREERQTPDCGFFKDPERSMPLYDYLECYSEAVNEHLEYYCKTLKEASDFRAVTGAFWGYLQNQDLLWGGQTRFKRMMDSPYLDIWASPYTYENKGPGQYPSMRYLVKSLQAHGKLWYAEADTFIYDSNPGCFKAHGFPTNTTQEQAREMLKRDFVYPLCEGTQAWWIDWSSGASQYDDKLFAPLMAQIQQIAQDSLSLDCTGVSEIAAVVDQESLHAVVRTDLDTKYADTPFVKIPPFLTYNALDRFRVHELPYIGAPVDFYETDDIFSGRASQHKMYIFLNFYSADETERRKLDLLKKNGNTLIFMYGAGLIAPGGAVSLGAENVSSLTGISMKMDVREQRAEMELTEAAATALGLTPGDKIGDFKRLINCGFDYRFNGYQPFYAMPNRISPVLSVEDREAEVFGTYTESGAAGFVRKKFADWTSIYIGSPMVQSYVLRALARAAGAHLYVDDRDVIVWANQSLVGIHTSTDGELTVHLPKQATVSEVFDARTVSDEPVESFREFVPKETTRLYKLK